MRPGALDADHETMLNSWEMAQDRIAARRSAAAAHGVRRVHRANRARRADPQLPPVAPATRRRLWFPRRRSVDPVVPAGLRSC